MEIRFTLNGRSVTAEVEKRQTLLSLIRDRFYLTEPNTVAASGDCGAARFYWTVRLSPHAICHPYRVDGRSVVTIEGINGENGALTPGSAGFSGCRSGTVRILYSRHGDSDDRSAEPYSRS